MDKTLAGLIGAAGLLATSAQAATAPPVTIGDAMQAHSYADLLKPIPNASALLKASDAAPGRAVEPGNAPEAKIIPAQWWWLLIGGPIIIITTITTTIITTITPERQAGGRLARRL